MTDRNAQIRDSYETSGMQGVLDRWGEPGVRSLLAEWRPSRLRLKSRGDQVLDVGADFCYHYSGGNTFRRGEMGVQFSVAGPYGAGGVFTMKPAHAKVFKDGIERVRNDDQYRSTSERMSWQIRVPNYCFGVTDSGAGQIEIGRSPDSEDSDYLTIAFSPPVFNGRRTVISIDYWDHWRLKNYVDDALAEVQRFVSAEARGSKLIERSAQRKVCRDSECVHESVEDRSVTP